jgi:tRNA threonylcarbamoyladenosine biosynthesis protein TsaE
LFFKREGEDETLINKKEEKADSMEITSFSPEQTRLIGECMAHHVYSGLTILLYGDLGAGKTVLVKGLGDGLGARGVRSPSFTLINEYEGRLPLAHVDLYRLERGDEYELGLCEYADDGFVLVIEWPDRLAEQPTKDLWKLYFCRDSETVRRISFKAEGEKAVKTMELLLKDIGEIGQ